MDADALAERILRDLDNIFSKDPFIAEVEVVPLEECVQNKCPVIHVAHQVAIESWCIKHVYQFTYRQLLNWRSRPHKIEASVLLGWTRAVLIINPDIQLAWNVRRELVGSQKQEIKDELQFSSIVVSRKPKCSEVFAHRRWLLERLLQSKGWDRLPEDLVEMEGSLCQKAASSYPHNYYAWSHRIWAVQRAATPPQQMVLKELERTEEWVQAHVSDYSGFQFRQFLFSWWVKHCEGGLPAAFSNCHLPAQNSDPFLGDPSKGCVGLLPSLLAEMDTNSKLILFYTGHEALWCHRRFVLHALLGLLTPGACAVPNTSATGDQEDRDLSQRVKRNRPDADSFGLDREASFVKECQEQSQNDKAQLLLASRHQDWIQKVLLPLSHCHLNTTTTTIQI